MTQQPLPQSDPEVLLFQTSPFGNLDAIVQQNGETVYFYLNQPPAKASQSKPFGTRACWVRNLVQGPLVFRNDQLDQGIPPVFPRTQTVTRGPREIPDPDSLEVIWFEEGNAAALYELSKSDAELLAVIPPWSGEKGFMGYSAECAVEHPMCAPIPDSPAFHHRVKQAREFWTSLKERPSQYAELQQQQIETYQKAIQAELQLPGPARYEQFDINPTTNFPPRHLVEYRSETELILLTTCLCFCPQPNVELSSPNPLQKRRIELGFRFELSTLGHSKIEAVRNVIASIANIPWWHFVWLDDGHTVDFPNILDGVSRARLAEASSDWKLEAFRGDPVRLLWVVPEIE